MRHPGDTAVRWRIITAGLLAASLSALDTTILSTVMPTIVADLGGLDLYSWAFASYMLMSAVSMPVWGRLADTLGKRRLFVAAVATFLTGSMLCGVSRSMLLLIIFRGLQGIGAGGLSSVPFALLSTYFPSHERGKALGILSSAWGVSSVIGPMIGSTVVTLLDWPWVFYINIPLGITSVWLVLTNYAEPRPLQRKKLDTAGALLLGLVIMGVMLSARSLGEGLRWPAAVQGSVVVLLTIIFLARERTASSPILPLAAFRQRGFWVGNLLGFLASFSMYAIIAYVPFFAQAVRGGTAVDAGMVIIPMSLSWSASSVVAGRLFGRSRGNGLIRFGMALMITGLALLLLTSYDSSNAFLASCVVMVGIGMGCQTPSLMLTVQESLPIHDLGIATSIQMLSRTIGGAIGVSVLGSILHGGVQANLQDGLLSGRLSGLTQSLVPLLAKPEQLLAPGIRGTLDSEVLVYILETFTGAFHAVCVTALIVVVAALLVSRLLPPFRFPEPRLTTRL